MEVEETLMEESLSKGLTSPAKSKWKPENSVVQYKKQHNTSDTNFNLVMNAIDKQLATTWDDSDSDDSDLEDDQSRVQSPTKSIQEEDNTTDWVPKEDETMHKNSQTVNSCTSTQVITSSTTVKQEQTVSGQNTEKGNTVQQGVASNNTTPPIQIPQPKKVRFGTNFVMKTTNNSSLQEVLKQRGMQMSDNQKKLVTPIKVEYNIPATQDEFNIFEQTQILLDLLLETDQTLRILDADKTTVLYEKESQLPEGEEFTSLFKVRQQIYRKGNRSFTIFCVVESRLSIQKIKYMDHVKIFFLEIIFG